MTRELAPNAGCRPSSAIDRPVGGRPDFIFLTGERRGQRQASGRHKRPDRLGGTTRPRGRQEADLHVLDLDERSPDTEGVANW